MDWEPLYRAARAARDRAHAPYSGFRVGAALLLEDGSVVTGCNVENRSYGLAICAERNAVAQAVARGARRFRALAVVTDVATPAAPCGMCRETLNEFADDLPILLANLGDERREVTLRALHPMPFVLPGEPAAPATPPPPAAPAAPEPEEPEEAEEAEEPEEPEARGEPKELAAAQEPVAPAVPVAPGGPEAAERRRGALLSGLYDDVRLAARSLRRHPGFLIVVLLTLALGLGANAAMWSAVDGLLLRPVPVPDPAAVLVIDRLDAEGEPMPIPVPTLLDWQRESRAFSHLGAMRIDIVNLAGNPRAERLVVAQVGAGFFPAMARTPLLGRHLSPSADTPGSAGEAVLSHRLWQRRFGADREIAGRAIRLDGELFTVVGVMPADFALPTPEVDMWLPIGAFVERLEWDNRSISTIDFAVGRVRPGTSHRQAELDLERVTAGIAEATGVPDQPRPRPRTLREALTGQIRQPLLVLLGAVGFVLLIVCANVANLMLARGADRRAELATRLALGATRGRLIVQVLTESLMLALGGALLGLPLAWLGLRLILRFLPADTPLIDRVGLDPRVLAITAALAVLTGILAGLVPALRFARTDLRAELMPGGRSTTARAGMRRALIVAEMALAVALLIGAGLMVQTLRGMARLDLGFTPDGVFVQRIGLDRERYPDQASWNAFYRALLDRLDAYGGTRAAALTTSLPFDGSGAIAGAIPEGTAPVRENLTFVRYQAVSADYHQALGIPLLTGRPLAPSDGADAPLVAVVDRGLAERFWPGRSALGKRMAFEFRFPPGGYREGVVPETIWREVVGVVGEVRQGDLRSEAMPAVYVPYTQPPYWLVEGGWPSMTLAVRTDDPPMTVAAPVRETIDVLDRNLPTYGVETLRQTIRRAAARERLLAFLLGLFSLLAQVLAAIGIYGVIAHGVRARRKELGLRMALGARSGRILRQVVGQGLRLAAVGVALGLAAAWASTRVLAGALYGVDARDPWIFVSVSALVLTVAALASLLPARQAARLDPMAVLRDE